MNEDFIDYGELIDEAMHVIVKKALLMISKEGLPGHHHFFISFVTDYPGVEISKALSQKYPDEMTIVLQHQFENLKVEEDSFSVVLSFDGVKERIKVPFDALVAFADPSVKFGLQFRHFDDMDEIEEELEAFEELNDEPEMDSKGKKSQKKDEKADKGKKSKKSTGNSNVVSIDNFRKK